MTGRLTLVIIVALSIVIASESAFAQTDTTFTYQGELKENGNPANGSFNIDFSLWDAASGGTQIGATIMFNGLPMVNGKFTVELDFGGGAFDNSERWLEIEVNGGPLSPRTPVTRTPYSIQTRGINVDADGNVGIGTTNPAWEFEVANLAPGDGAESGVTAEDAAGAIAAYSSTLPPPFDHFGGRVSLFGNAIDIRADSVNGDMRFYSGGPWPTNERMRISSSGGIRATSYLDDGMGSWEQGFYFVNNSNGLGPWSHAGIWTDGVSGFNGELVFGVDGDDTNNLDGIQEAMRINKSGNVGVGTSIPEYALHVAEDTNDFGGIQVETAAGGKPYYGYATNGFTRAYHYYDDEDDEWRLWFDGSDRVRIWTGEIFPFTRLEVVDAFFGTSNFSTGPLGVNVSDDMEVFGDLDVSGTLTKSGGSFKIDHPLDPSNKFLSHSFVESPDMMNIYNGNLILDGSGRATIRLPDWFEALNREFRYQLTCIGGFATVYVESEIENNQFTIAGGNAGLKVSWQVTGVRQDAWAEANRIPVEEQKFGFEAGHYLHPEVYDSDRSMSILAAREAHISERESKAAMNEFQEEKQIEATASRYNGKFHTPHIKRERQ